MPFFLARLISRLVFLRSWVTPAAVVVFVFVTSWPLMALAEPAGSELVRPANYWWYFVVTAATVGYGDFFPESGTGHLVGAYVILGGIVALTTVFTKLAAILEDAKGRRMQGASPVRATGHTILLGYTAGRTERLVRALIADGSGPLVLGAWDEVGTHPMPEQDIDFVRGDLTDEGVLRRAGIERARAVLVDVRDDNEALAVAVTIGHLDPGAHVVVTLRNLQQADLIRYVDPDFRCVQWHTPRMVTEELTSPGIAEVYAELMTQGGAGTFSAELPRETSVEQCQTALGRRFGATLLAVRTADRLVVNPAWDVALPAGATFYYVSPRRLTAEEIRGTLAESPASRPGM